MHYEIQRNDSSVKIHKSKMEGLYIASYPKTPKLKTSYSNEGVRHRVVDIKSKLKL
jgi:hypothetical protein